MSAGLATVPPSETPLPSMLDLLYPLSEFLSPGDPVPLCPQEVGGERMPEPYRSLLVHDADMTSTLRAFHGDDIALRLLERRQEGESLFRRVVLVTKAASKPVEFGAIRIALSEFSGPAQRAILFGRRPLGTILADFQVSYTSRPRLFFRIESDPRIERLFGMSASATLFGRQNVLLAPSGRPLAEVVEILPPADAAVEAAVVAESGLQSRG